MTILFLICVIFLSLNVARFAIGAVVIIFTGKVPGKDKKLGFGFRFWNFVECCAICWAYVQLLIYWYTTH